MKKIIVLMAFLVCGLIYSQKSEYVKNGDLVEVTYKYDNGNLKEHGFFKDAKLHGNWTYYNTQGDIKITARYNNGIKVGKWTYVESDLIKIVSYKKGKIVSVSDILIKS